jgi:hypothetical protein
MNRIRSSLQTVPIFSQNLTLASKKMSERQTEGSDSASRMNSSPSSRFGENAVGDYELFE